MGSLSRKLKRTQAKADYQTFAGEWRAEKAKRAKAGQSPEKVSEEFPLGKRPSFRYWKGAVSAKALEIEAAIKAAVSKEKIAEEVKDLAWDEEDAKPAETVGLAVPAEEVK